MLEPDVVDVLVVAGVTGVVEGVTTPAAETPLAALTDALLTLLDALLATFPAGKPDALPIGVPAPPVLVAVVLLDGRPVEVLITEEGSFMLPGFVTVPLPLSGNPVALLTLAPASPPEALPTDVEVEVVASPVAGVVAVGMLFAEPEGSPVELPIAPALTLVVPGADAAVPVTAAPELASPAEVPVVPAPFAMAGTARASKRTPYMKGAFSMRIS